MHATTTPPTWQQRLTERARPRESAVLLQRWEQLLFLHWRFEPERIQATLPPGLTADTFQGHAWLGVVPLFMRNVRPRFVPPVSAVSDFFELNVRTYVYDAHGRPGIYFYALDCDQPLAVETARRLLHLRYEHCQIRAGVDADGVVDFEAQHPGAEAKARFRYQPIGPPEEAKPESLEFFLIERYRLFAADDAGEQLSTIRVSHAPYLLRMPLVLEWSDWPLHHAGLQPQGRAPDHMCMSEPVDVETFAPEKVE
jgi:uncharacterized protein YqjF (DUF2071 family)